MTIEQLKTKIFLYFGLAETSDEFELDDEDFLLDAINAAKKTAELRHAFELNKKLIVIPVTASAGGNWMEATIAGTETDVSVRSLKKAYLIGDGGAYKEVPMEYRSLATGVDSTQRPEVHAHIIGDTIHLTPRQDASLYVDAYIWTPDFTDESDTDSSWFLRQGDQYLFWGALWELNHKQKEWVPRQEGNLTLSNEKVEEELQKLIAWDNQIKNAQFNMLP
jgi:hypothetical protein